MQEVENENQEPVPQVEVDQPISGDDHVEASVGSDSEVTSTDDQNESAKAPEGHARRLKLRKEHTVNYTEGSKTVEPHVHDQKSLTAPINVFGYNATIASLMMQAAGCPVTEEEHSRLNYSAPARMFEERLMRDGSEWLQQIPYGSHALGPRIPKLKNLSGEVSGPAAIALLKKETGRGTPFTFPLWRSGIWLTMRSAPDSELVQCDFKISNHRALVGLSTAGILLSATSGVFSDILVRQALNQVTSTSVTNLESGLVSSLLDRIDPLDYPAVIWGALAANHPAGFDYFIDCIDKNCGHSDPVKFNFRRMEWTDKSALSDAQLAHMYSTADGVTDEQLATYRNGFVPHETDTLVLQNGVTVKFKSRTLRDYLTTSIGWANELERQHAEALSGYSTDEARDAYLDNMIQARRMQKYTHLVDELIIPNSDATIRDRETIHDALAEMSTCDYDVLLFEQGALKYIENATVSVIGYVSDPCSACGITPVVTEGEFRSIVPIQVDRVFFTHVRLKVDTLSELAQST